MGESSAALFSVFVFEILYMAREGTLLSSHDLQGLPAPFNFGPGCFYFSFIGLIVLL